MTACSFAVLAHVCWNWGARAARTAIPLFILGRTLSTCRSLDMRRLGSIRRPCRGFCVTTRRADFEAFVAARNHLAEKMNHGNAALVVPQSRYPQRQFVGSSDDNRIL